MCTGLEFIGPAVGAAGTGLSVASKVAAPLLSLTGMAGAGKANTTATALAVEGARLQGEFGRAEAGLSEGAAQISAGFAERSAAISENAAGVQADYAVRNAQLRGAIARANAETLLGNADVEHASGELAIARGTLDVVRKHAEVDRILAGQSAHFVKNHLDPSYGSPLMLAYFTAGRGEADAQLIESEARVNYAESVTRETSLRRAAVMSRFDEFAAADTESQAIATRDIQIATAREGARQAKASATFNILAARMKGTQSDILSKFAEASAYATGGKATWDILKGLPTLASGAGQAFGAVAPTIARIGATAIPQPALSGADWLAAGQGQGPFAAI